MIICDTNVVSEPMRPKPDANVLAWLDSQIEGALFLTSVSLAELLTGIALLPEGRKKSDRADVMEFNLNTLFGDRVLGFDGDAARAFSDIMAGSRKAGKAIAFADGQIAAIAKVHGFTVATRDTKPFLAAGVEVIDPWKGTAA